MALANLTYLIYQNFALSYYIDRCLISVNKYFTIFQYKTDFRSIAFFNDDSMTCTCVPRSVADRIVGLYLMGYNQNEIRLSGHENTEKDTLHLFM